MQINMQRSSLYPTPPHSASPLYSFSLGPALIPVTLNPEL